MRMLRAFPIIVVSLLPHAARGSDALPPPEALHAPEALREDLRFLTGALIRNHPHLHRYLSPDAFDQLVARTEAAFTRPMTASEFLREARPLVAAVRCLHTSLRASDAEANLSRERPVLPLPLVAADGRLYLTRDLEGNPPLPAGTEILAVNGMPARDLLEAALAGISSDGWNETYKLWRFHHGPPGALVASFLGNPERYEILCAPPGAAAVLRRIDARPLVDPERPASRAGERSDEAHSVEFSTDPDGRCAVLTIRQFPRSRSPSFASSLADAFRSIEDRGIDGLVIDLRGNLGGAPENAAELLAYLSPESFVYFSEAIAPYAFLKQPIQPHATRFRGRLLVLMDGGCASTSGHLLALLRYHRLGILVGKESAGSFTCNDNSTYVAMRNTGVVLRVARSEFRVAVEGLVMGRGVFPDIEIEPSLADVLAGRDPAMDEAVRVATGSSWVRGQARWGRP